MQNFIHKILTVFNRYEDKLPEDMDTVEELKTKAQDLIEQQGDKLDQVTDKIPGETDDKLVDQAREALKKK